MATGTFPTDHNNRKVILILHSHDIEKCGYAPGAAQILLDDNIYILAYPVTSQKKLPQAMQNIIDARLACSGNMLIQNPYDTDTYEEITVAPQRFALAKHMYFSILCKHLGAKEVLVEQISIQTRSGKSVLSGKGERLGASVHGTIAAEELEKIHAQMHLHDEFEGGPADVEAAELLLRRTGLYADPSLRILIDMRREHANTLKTRKFCICLSSESKNNLNIAARLNMPQFINISSDYKRITNEQHNYSLTVTVKF